MHDLSPVNSPDSLDFWDWKGLQEIESNPPANTGSLQQVTQVGMQMCL